MTREDAIVYLQKVVTENKEYKFYKRRTELAQEYFDYYTGNLNARLKRTTQRESDEEFEQRKNLTNHITGAILNSIKLPFQKASRKQPIVKTIKFEGQSDDTKRKEIETFLTKYNGDKSLDQFLELMLVEYNLIDPNAFLIVEYEPNTEREKVKPYPFIAKSDQVIDYNFINGIIEYVIVKLPIKFIENGKERDDGFKYTQYNGNETIVLERVGIDQIIPLNIVTVMINGKDKYIQTVYEVKAEGDPDLIPAAIQFGYILDPETNYETYLSIFHCGLPYLRKTLKVNSELDQSMSMMAFPQRYRYVPSCNNPDCHSGYLHDGTTICPSCGGTGKAKAHKGAQDVQELDLPKNVEEMIDLAKLAYDHTPSIELLKFDDEFLKQLKVNVHTTVFNADIFSKPEVTATATEKNIDVDNMNDTLYAFCRRYSQIWRFNVQFIAVFTDNAKKEDKIIIEHKFPDDLKLKTLSDLMADLAAAHTANASAATIAAIEKDINEILYSDRPSELKKINIQQQFNPFKGSSPTDVQYYLSSNSVSKFNKTLYINYANIWNELELDNPDIYNFDNTKIWGLIKSKIEEIQNTLTEETPKPVMKLNFNNLNNAANG